MANEPGEAGCRPEGLPHKWLARLALVGWRYQLFAAPLLLLGLNPSYISH